MLALRCLLTQGLVGSLAWGKFVLVVPRRPVLKRLLLKGTFEESTLRVAREHLFHANFLSFAVIHQSSGLIQITLPF